MKRVFGTILAAALFAAGGARAAEINIAAAADLKFAMDELVARFQTNHSDVAVKVTFGSSGNFFAQIQNHAPFDMYFSADIEYPRKLAEAGNALDAKVFLYAIGRLVVWAPTNAPLDVQTLGIKALLEPSVKKIAIANPQHAPYGRAAVSAMKSLKVYEQSESRLVFGENIAQAAQFAQTGAAEIGIIALSLAVAPQMRDAGRYWQIPLDSYPRLQQGGIILKWTKEPQGCRAFRDFVLSTRGRDVLGGYGFSQP